jgi:predicted nucleotidyltransferase
MPTEQDLQTAQQIRDRILEAAGDAVERIVFYGSRVTGRARPTSDYDILVVLRDPVPAWAEASLQLSDLFNTFERSVDVQVFGEVEYEESRPVAGTVAYPADHHGVRLYVKPASTKVPERTIGAQEPLRS